MNETTDKTLKISSVDDHLRVELPDGEIFRASLRPSGRLFLQIEELAKNDSVAAVRECFALLFGEDAAAVLFELPIGDIVEIFGRWNEEVAGGFVKPRAGSSPA